MLQCPIVRAQPESDDRVIWLRTQQPDFLAERHTPRHSCCHHEDHDLRKTQVHEPEISHSGHELEAQDLCDRSRDREEHAIVDPLTARTTRRIAIECAPGATRATESSFAVDASIDRIAPVCFRGEDPSTIELFEFSSTRRIGSISMTRPVDPGSQMALLDASHLLVAASPNCTLGLGEPIRCAIGPGIFRSMVVGPDGQRVASLSGMQLIVMNLQTGNPDCVRDFPTRTLPTQTGFLGPDVVWARHNGDTQPEFFRVSTCTPIENCFPVHPEGLLWSASQQYFVRDRPPALVALDGSIVRALPWTDATVLDISHDGDRVLLQRENHGVSSLEVRSLSQTTRTFATLSNAGSFSDAELCGSELLVHRSNAIPGASPGLRPM